MSQDEREVPEFANPDSDNTSDDDDNYEDAVENDDADVTLEYPLDDNPMDNPMDTETDDTDYHDAVEHQDVSDLSELSETDEEDVRRLRRSSRVPKPRSVFTYENLGQPKISRFDITSFGRKRR